MKVAVLSDVHDRLDRLRKALEGSGDASVLLFLGDFCAPFTLKELAEGFVGSIHAVLGNNDGDPLLLERVAQQSGHVTLYAVLARLDLDGASIAIAHYPEVGEALAKSGDYQAVFSGHTHRVSETKIGRTLWVNPGEVMGRYGEPSYGLYDTATGHFDLRRI